MKNEFIVLEQPRRLVFSVVLVDTVLPIPESDHKRIQELSKVSDLFLIFPEKKNINARIFASLYKACGYIEAGKNERCSEILMRTLEYDLEIFRSHSLVLFTQFSNLPTINDPEKLQRIVASDINKPIFKMRKLESAEFFEIYQEKVEKKPWYYFPWTTSPQNENGSDNLYCSETSESSSIIVRPGIVKRWLEFWKKDPGYIHSFSRVDQRFLIASMCEKLEIETLGIELDELEI